MSTRTSLVAADRVILAGGLDAVHAGHPDVHQHDVGMMPPGLLDRLRAGAGLADPR